MDGIVSVFTNLPNSKTKRDDDTTDRLSNRYTVIILVVFAIVVSMHQYVGTPITCWVPQHFTGSHTKYTNSYCWVRNTYYLHYDDYIPKEHEHEKRDMIPYYQWISFILLGQAILFYLPSVVWHGFNQKAGVDADNILASAQSFNKTDKEEARENTLKLVRNQIDRFLVSRKDVKPQGATLKQTLVKGQLINRSDKRREKIRLALFTNRRFGGYLIALYLVTKVLYLVNVIAQLFILNSVLSIEYSVYGWEVFTWMLRDHDWTTSPQVAFPRVSMCDFKVRRLGNIHRYTVQCTLPINLYNEKIFMFMWFWMVAVAILTAISFVTWLTRVVSPNDRKVYIKNHLRMMKRIDADHGDEDSRHQSHEQEMANNFVTNYLRQDGVFLLRLIGHNTNTITVSEIIAALWDKYEERQKGLPASAPEDTLKPTTETEPMLPKEKEAMESMA